VPTYARILKGALGALALLVVTYHAADIFWSLNSAMPHYVTHLGLILAVVALKWAVDGANHPDPRRGRWHVAFALTCLGAATFAAAYLYTSNETLEVTQPFLTRVQFLVGALLIGTIFLLNWVVWGTALTMVCLAAALYFGFGHLVPGPMADLALDSGLIMSNLAGMGSPRGLFMYIPLSADTIILLLVYGGLMSATRVLDMFAELGNAIGNYLRGGVAYSCVAASSLIGMVTGQTVSCIALTGSMTIPTMIRGGFRKEDAGAIEVMAANGSQLIPPIMGLGAFLMAVITGISYVEIARAAIFPAMLYVLILVIGIASLIHSFPSIGFTAARVDTGRIFWILPSFIPSIGAVILLLYLRYSANLAAFTGIVVLLIASIARPRRYRPRWSELFQGVRDGVIAGAHLGLILAAIGIIVQVLLTSGLGTEFSRLMVALSGKNLEVALIIGMAIALVIGMGLPTPAAYSLCTIVMIPPLIDVGLEPLVAHFFGFYFAVLSAITPPVAVGILMAVRISGGSFTGTALSAITLGGVCLLLPFFMVAFPDSLAFPNIGSETLFAAVVACFGTACLGAAAYGSLVGRLGILERLVLAGAVVAVVLFLKYKSLWLGVAVITAYLAILSARIMSRRFAVRVSVEEACTRRP
jgi:TRAP transporter 4TM/12TM fusion protein